MRKRVCAPLSGQMPPTPSIEEVAERAKFFKLELEQKLVVFLRDSVRGK